MTVVSVKEGAVPEVLALRLSDGSSLLFRLSYLADPERLPALGAFLSDEELDACRIASRAYEAELRALRLLALSEQSRGLLELKLRKRGFSEASVRPALDRLEAGGLIDDERFARAWVRARTASKAESGAKLLAGLLSKGLSKDVAARAVREEFGAEGDRESLMRLLGKWGVRSSYTEILRDRKTLGKLKSAGFSLRQVRGALLPDEE